MKTRFLASCAILALIPSAASAGDLTGGNGYYAPPPAAAAASYGPTGIFGDVNLSGTYYGGDIPDDFSLDLGGTVVVPFGNGWNAALEHELGYMFDAHDWVAAGTGHIFYNNMMWAAGAFAYLSTEDTHGIGVEAAAFVNNFDIIGELGYYWSSPDYLAASGGANVYFDPNTAVSGNLGVLFVDGGSDGWEADVGFEHRFESSPFSGFAELGWVDLDGSNAFNATAGARFVFGDSGSTLQDFNRRNPF